MDSLRSLPSNESELNFVDGEGPVANDDYNPWTDKGKWMAIGLVALLFIVFTNPFISKLLVKIPYIGDNDIVLWLGTFLVFIAIAIPSLIYVN